MIDTRPDLYILDGRTPVPVADIAEWGNWFTDFDRRRVAKTEIGDVLVSTVFLGTDHDFLGTGPPILFETMIFGAGKLAPKLDAYQDRYATWDDAEAGHARAVELVRAALNRP